MASILDKHKFSSSVGTLIRVKEPLKYGTGMPVLDTHASSSLYFKITIFFIAHETIQIQFNCLNFYVDGFTERDRGQLGGPVGEFESGQTGRTISAGA